MKTPVIELRHPLVALDPSQVPYRILYTGNKMPALGLGTFGFHRVPHSALTETARPTLLGTDTSIEPLFTARSDP